MQLHTLDAFDARGKRVLVRVDFNVPFAAVAHIASEGDISNDFRIRAVIPTVKRLVEAGAIPILLAHRGRPQGKKDAALSLKPIHERLVKLMARPIIFVEDCIGERALAASRDAKPGDILLLENLRFYPGEDANDNAFARSLASLGELYVNEAFGDAHRAHASMIGLPSLMPHAAGPLMIRELAALGTIRDNPPRPLVAVMGGAKISTKIMFLEKFLPWVDGLLLGGALANTLLNAKGLGTGTSFIEPKMASRVAAFDHTSAKVHLPMDVVVAREARADAETFIRGATSVGPRESIFDIGSETQKEFRSIILDAKTVFWNGPMGFHELPIFAKGTEAVARAIADSQAFSVVGGGDTAVILERLALADKIEFISTGGGAMLEFLCGQELPGVTALLSA